MKATTLVILAAGLGTRFGGIKQLAPITNQGETILDFSIFDALECGMKRFVFVVRTEILDSVRKRYEGKLNRHAETFYVCQDEFDPKREEPWGTGHAVLSSREVVSGSFLVINADDFYGRSAFELMTGRDADPEKADFALAGYRLDKTLSEHGPVSRGECFVTGDGKLTALLERKAVLRDNDGISYNNGHRLSAETTVSMNFWAFTPRVFDILETRFARFVDKEDAASEFFLNEALSDAVAKKDATIEVLRTDSDWLGVTYRDDTRLVADRLSELRAKGEYPERLWK